MKKSLIALAVLGAFATGAQAQTNVSIGGVIQADVKNFKVGSTARVVKNEVRIDDDYTSRFWLTGTEDLGGGLSALFYVENRFSTDQRQSTGLADGAGLADGNTYLGLKGNFGQVTVGKHTMMAGEGAAVEYGITGVQALPSSSLATNTILNYVGNQVITNSRVVNSIVYTSPKFSGFTGVVGVSTNAGGNEGVINGTNTYSDGRAYFLKGNYSNGPIYLNAAYWDNKIEGRPVVITPANADQKQFRLSGSYAFPFGLKAGLQFDRATLKNAVAAGVDRKRNAWEIPVSYQFGQSTVLASFTKANDYSGTDNTGAKLWTLGYDYALSKRTNVGAFYSKLSNDNLGNYTPYKTNTSQNGSSLVAGESAQIFAVSVKHTF